MFELIFTPQADSDLQQIENDPSKKNILKAVRKTLGLMETNLKHPSMLIPLNPAGHSDPKRPLVPIDSGHLFVGAKRRWC